MTMKQSNRKGEPKTAYLFSSLVNGTSIIIGDNWQWQIFGGPLGAMAVAHSGNIDNSW